MSRAMRPQGQRPLDYEAFELQLLRPSISSYWAPSVALGSLALMLTEGNTLYLLSCALVVLVASLVMYFNRTGNTRRLRQMLRAHGLLLTWFYLHLAFNVVPRMWISGAATTPPVLLFGDFCLQLFCIPFHVIIGIVPDMPMIISATYVLAHALLLGAFHRTVGGRSWPVALGRGVCVEMLCVIASIALKPKCKAVYAAYLQRHDRDLAVACSTKHGQQTESMDWTTAEGVKPKSSETSRGAPNPASNPDMGTQSTPMGALSPQQPCQASSASPAASTTVLEGSAGSSNMVYQSRLRRRQVHIRIEATGIEQDLMHSDFAATFSRRLKEELPNYFAPEVAVREGCIILSFDLATSEAVPAQGPGLQALPSLQAGKQLLPARAQSKLLSLAQGVLQEYGPKLGLSHGTEISVQVDGCTVSCKWDAEDREWTADSITASATAAGVASKAGMCQFRLHSPVLQIPSLATGQPAKCQQADLQQLDQPDRTGHSAPLLVAASLRGQHAGGRVVQGWGAAAQREELNTAASPAPGSMTAGDGLALQLVARTQGCFLPVVMAHQSPVRPDEQLMEAHVLLPSCLVHASDPFALELELWAQDVCLSSHPALAVPSHLTCLAQEMSAWAAAVNQLHPSNGSPSDDFVRDVADFLAFCKERKHCHQSQAEAMEAIGRDLLQFAIDASMEGLAAHLRHKLNSLLSPDPESSNHGTASSSSSSSSEPGAANEGTAAATAPGQLGHRHLPLAYDAFEYQFLKPCINYWALPVIVSAITVFCTSEGGISLFLLSVLVISVAAMMVAYNRAGAAKSVRRLFRIHAVCWLSYYLLWTVGAATAQPVMLFGDYSMRLFCVPFHLVIGMGSDVPRLVPLAYTLTHALLLGAFHAIVGGKTWPAALGRGACVELLGVIASVALKRKLQAVYAAYLQRHDRDLAVACSTKQG